MTTYVVIFVDVIAICTSQVFSQTMRDGLAMAVDIEMRREATMKAMQSRFNFISERTITEASGFSPHIGQISISRRNDMAKISRLSRGARIQLKALQLQNRRFGPLDFSGRQFENYVHDSAQFCDNEAGTLCNINSRYRETDGQCNNLFYKALPSGGFKLGAAFTAQSRFLPADYDDGIGKPRTRSKVDGKPLPNTRTISNKVHSGPSFLSDRLTTFYSALGLLLTLDLASTPTEDTLFIPPRKSCCDFPEHEQCFNIGVASDDVLGGTCMPFTRSECAPEYTCKPSPRLQMNQRSSFIDNSAVYGWNKEREDMLRLFKDGKLKTGIDGLLPEVPPETNGSTISCVPPVGRGCFLAGDHRISLTPTLTTIHLVFLRRHNVIAHKLKLANPFWNDEILYQEAKRIAIAEMQHIVYKEFIPALLGRTFLREYDLQLSASYADNYRKTLNPSLSTAFSTAAFRFGHSMVRNIQSQIGEGGTPELPTLISNNFNVPETHQDIFRMFRGRATEASARWMSKNFDGLSDGSFSDSVRNELFKCKISRESKSGCPISGRTVKASDLVALNIQRGRDHGLPPYTAWRKWCSGKTTLSFKPHSLGLSDHSPFEARILQNTYRHVDDIDLYTGGLTEKRVPGAIVGPTFACIIAEQFRLLKNGDRFWYERPDPRVAFTKAQLHAIKTTSLAKVLCSTLKGFEGIQPEAMFMAGRQRNKRMSCSHLRRNDFVNDIPGLWRSRH